MTEIGIVESEVQPVEEPSRARRSPWRRLLRDPQAVITLVILLGFVVPPETTVWRPY